MRYAAMLGRTVEASQHCRLRGFFGERRIVFDVFFACWHVSAGLVIQAQSL